MAGSERVVTFYFGVGSRYSYLAASQIAGLAKRTGASFVWRAVMSSRLADSPDFAPFRWDSEAQDWWGARVSGQYREAYRQTDLARWAGLYQVPYQEPKPLAMNAMRRTLYCVAAAELGDGQAFAMAMLSAIYAKGIAIEEGHCRDIAASECADPQAVIDMVESETAYGIHETWLSQARRSGVFGVPSFVLAHEVFWGNDRLPLLEAAL